MLKEIFKRLADLDVTIKWVEPNRIVFIRNVDKIYLSIDYNDEYFTDSSDKMAFDAFIKPILIVFEREPIEVDCGLCCSD